MAEIVVHEVGPRDGLQMEHETVPTEKKIAWIEQLCGAGLDVVQVGSFVNPKRVPQMADTDELFRQLRANGRTGQALLSGLVLNEKGLDRGLAAGVDLFCMGVSASETHSQKNTGKSIADATTEIVAMAKRAISSGKRAQVSVQSAFGCGFEGEVPEDRVLGIVQSFLDAGLRNLSLADTAGHATPDAVERLFGRIREKARDAELACHFHNTYGLALANCYAALRAGVVSIETSVAGLGGCPFTAVAGGNACTEDFVHYLHRAGLRRDVSLEPIIEVARDVAGFFKREMAGSVYRTGPIPQKAAVS